MHIEFCPALLNAGYQRSILLNSATSGLGAENCAFEDSQLKVRGLSW
jgi:hypothetical protein